MTFFWLLVLDECSEDRRKRKTKKHQRSHPFLWWWQNLQKLLLLAKKTSQACAFIRSDQDYRVDDWTRINITPILSDTFEVMSPEATWLQSKTVMSHDAIWLKRSPSQKKLGMFFWRTEYALVENICHHLMDWLLKFFIFILHIILVYFTIFSESKLAFWPQITNK